MELSAGRNTAEIRDGRTLVLPVKANTKIFEGSLVAMDSTGYAIPGKAGVGLLAAGRAEEYVDNTGAGGTNGARTVRVRRGVFKFNNDTEDAVTAQDILKDCYILDDETVTMASEGNSKAGKVIGLDDGEVIVEIL